MQVKKEELSKTKVKLTVSLDESEWNQVIDKAISELGAHVELPGFRAGKAPKDMIIGKVGEARVISHAIELAVEQYYGPAAMQEELRPVAYPSIAIEQAGLTEPLSFVAEIPVLPEIKLGDYKTIKLAKKVEPLPEAQVDQVIEDMRKRAAEQVVVEREVQEGDWVEIDFTGLLDGVPFPGGESKHHPMVIGDKMFIPGFEEGIVGMKVGENKLIDVKFPDDYHAKELAGKDVKFDIKLHQVKSINLPLLDDAFAAKVSQFQTVEELKKDISTFLNTEAEKKADEALKEEAVLELTKLLDAELPEEMINQELDGMVSDLKNQVVHSQTTFEDYLAKANTTEAALRVQWRDQAIQRLKAGLALDAFRRAEGIEISHDEIHAEIDRLKELYPQQADEIDKQYGDHHGHGGLENMLVTRKAVDKLVEMVQA